VTRGRPVVVWLRGSLLHPSRNPSRHTLYAVLQGFANGQGSGCPKRVVFLREVHPLAAALLHGYNPFSHSATNRSLSLVPAPLFLHLQGELAADRACRSVERSCGAGPLLLCSPFPLSLFVSLLPKTFSLSASRCVCYVCFPFRARPLSPKKLTRILKPIQKPTLEVRLEG